MQLDRKKERGKLEAPNQIDALVKKGDSQRLHLQDKASRLKFLIGTRSDISIIPNTGNKNVTPSEFSLYAANNSQIATFGTKRLEIDFGLRRVFAWDFCIADVPYPIIGADFLSHFGLLVNLRACKVIDSLTNIGAIGTLKNLKFSSVSTIDRTSEYANIIDQFPEVTNLHGPAILPNCTTVHHILTKGPSIAQSARKLHPEKLKIAIPRNG